MVAASVGLDTAGYTFTYVCWARRAKPAQSLALRAKIVLACADGRDNKTVASDLGCASAKISRPVHLLNITGRGRV